MNYGTQLIILIIFGLIGFVMDKIIGIDPFRIFSDLTAAITVIALISFVFPAATNPDAALSNMDNMINFFVESLPSIVIGDAAGTIVSRITEEL